MPTSTRTGRELRKLLGPLRRAVTRAVPAPEHALALSEAQIELLRCLAHTSPQTTTELAARLHLARPTVSNLVKGLSRNGMVVRELSPVDARAVLIQLSARSRAELADADVHRDATLQRAIDDLDDDDRAAIERALPALARLLERLREDAGTESDGQERTDG